MLSLLKHTVCSQFERDNIICATNLNLNLFTTHAIDNNDYNISLNIGKDSFHGAAITIVQHLENSSDDN